MTEMPDTQPESTGQLRPERLGSREELRPERLGSREELRPERLGSREELRPEPLGGSGELRPERLGEPLSTEEVRAQAAELPCWQVADEGQALVRTFSFPSLRAAVAFVAMVAEIGEADGYVPEVDLRLLEVTVRIDTQVGEGLTALDFQVARSLGAA